MPKSHYIYINSKNRNSNEKINNFKVILKNPIICGRNQGFNISVIGFSMLNTDYNLRDVFFKVDSVRLSDNQEITYTYNIPNGNYSYQSLMDYLNIILIGKINVSYIKERNAYKFKNLDSSNYDFYIVPFNASKYLGLNNELSLTDGDYHEGEYINLTNYSHIIIKSTLLDFEDNTQDNINNKELGASNILFMIDKQDILPYQLISYRNQDKSDNYSYNINNRQISMIDLILYNELGEELTNISDYLLTLKIVINDKEIQNKNNNSILEDIKFILMSMMFGNNKNKNLLL
jgi:hypothetical protein